MPNALVRKLEGYAPLDASDRERLLNVCEKTAVVEADRYITRAGDSPKDVVVILEGLAVRSKLLRDGRRQILAFLVAGDFCDLHVAVLDQMDHDILAIMPCTVARISRNTVQEMTETRPKLARALWWCTLVDEATLREWLVNLGQRDAEQRIAHLFCELHTRLHTIGLTTDGSFSLPITQDELGDTMGLSAVHVNRSLKSLRDAGLVTFRGRVIHIPDVERLQFFADFDPSYLHLRHGPAAVNSVPLLQEARG
jgi:CRP-like cAMP-binding protein